MRHLLAAAMLTLLTAGPALAAGGPEGEWLTPGGKAKVRIAPCAAGAERLCGTIVWLKDPNGSDGRPVRDANNPDPKLKTRPIVGLPFLTGFKKASEVKWTGGKIYDPESGKTYASNLSLQGQGALKVEGCVLMVCQGQVWKRP